MKCTGVCVCVCREGKERCVYKTVLWRRVFFVGVSVCHDQWAKGHHRKRDDVKFKTRYAGEQQTNGRDSFQSFLPQKCRFTVSISRPFFCVCVLPHTKIPHRNFPQVSNVRSFYTFLGSFLSLPNPPPFQEKKKVLHGSPAKIL